MKHPLILLAFISATTCAAQTGRDAVAHGPYTAKPLPHITSTEHGGGPPANDDCANAIPLTLTLDCLAPVLGTTIGATMAGPQPSCDDPDAVLMDVWYSFTTGADGIVLITLAPSPGMTDWAFVIYDACDGAEVDCRIQPDNDVQEELEPFSDYRLRIYSNPNYGDPGELTLCIRDAGSIPAPANDDCANVISEELVVGGSLSFTGDATYALNTEVLPLNSVWEAFYLVAPADVHIDLCGSAASFPEFFQAVYRTCPPNITDRVFAGSVDHSSCPDGAITLCYPALPAGTYYYAVTNGTAPGTYQMQVTADPVGTVQALNDDCAGAIPISVGEWCDPTPFHAICTSASQPTEGCAEGLGFADDDVWYSFTPSSNGMTIGFFPTSAGLGGVLAAYSGTCGDPTSIGCVNGFDGDTLELVLTDLIVGDVYYLQVYNGYEGITSVGGVGYDLCVVEGTGVHVGFEAIGHASIPSLFPNPSAGDLQLHVDPRSSMVTITVYDPIGRMVLQPRSHAAVNGTVTMNAGALVSGPYTVRVDDGWHSFTARLVIQH